MNEGQLLGLSVTLTYNNKIKLSTFSYVSGFIDFIVEPSMAVMGDLLDKILVPKCLKFSNSQQGYISEEKSVETGN